MPAVPCFPIPPPFFPHSTPVTSSLTLQHPLHHSHSFRTFSFPHHSSLCTRFPFTFLFLPFSAARHAFPRLSPFTTTAITASISFFLHLSALHPPTDSLSCTFFVSLPRPDLQRTSTNITFPIFQAPHHPREPFSSPTLPHSFPNNSTNIHAPPHFPHPLPSSPHQYHFPDLYILPPPPTYRRPTATAVSC